MKEQPILSICIPIHNRQKYLDMMLERFLCDKELFEQEIQLYISDNCSTDNLQLICEQYKIKGLNLEYHRNPQNFGMDGNFINCFKSARGKYVWVLGSDDIPAEGILSKIINLIKDKNIASVHLNYNTTAEGYRVYHNAVEYLKVVNIFITYLSCNIISTSLISKFDFEEYRGTFISQVPIYLATILSGKDSILYNCKYLKGGNDSKNNGGYKFFQVFMVNYFSIWYEFVNKGAISRKDFEYIKRITFEKFLLDYVFRTLIGEPSQALDMSGCKRITLKYFWNKPYLYRLLFRKYKEHYRPLFRHKVQVARIKFMNKFNT